MRKVYMYVVDRDYGFAPNPFHGHCTLATCKPIIRRTAKVEDWVIGMGGSRLHATGKCIFAMCVTEKVTFNQYWDDPEFLSKKPVRNGSSKMMVGDNIYFQDEKTKHWNQIDSHHSYADGTINLKNLKSDTQTDRVLISDYFLYFGSSAPVIPSSILGTIGYHNIRHHRVFSYNQASPVIDWLINSFKSNLNQVTDDPFDFDKSEERYPRPRKQVVKK